MTEGIDNISLIVDVSIIAIVLISALAGKTKGFFRTIMSFFRWIISITLPFFFVSPLRTFLIENTNMDENILAHISVNTNAPFYESSYFEHVIPPFGDTVEKVEPDAVNHINQYLCHVIVTIIAFFILFVAVRLITSIIYHCFPEKNNDSFAGHIDGFFGFLFGTLRGLAIVCLIMLIAFPLFSMAGTGTAAPLIHGIRQSKIGNFLYFTNPILYIINTL